MDENDRSNLIFLLAADEKTIRDWYSKTSKEDHQYAKWLLDEYKKEVHEYIQAYRIEEQLTLSDFKESKCILNKIMKK